MTEMFQIAPSSGAPIYRQVMDQVQRLALSGHLRPGDELPSVRQVAEELAVNPMTISKAYSMLEAMGILERRRGKVMVVAEQPDRAKDQERRLAVIRPILVEVSHQARQLALPGETVLCLLKEIMEDRHD